MKVLSFKNSKLYDSIEFIKERKFVILYSIIILLGLILGSIFSGKQGLQTINLNFFFQNFLVSRRNSTFSFIFLNTLLSNILYLFILLLSGMFAFGGVLNGLVLFFKGSSLGLLMGYSYLSYGLKGVAFSILIILPGAFILSLALVIAAKESCLFSLNFLKLLSNKIHYESISLELKTYLVRFLVILIFIIFSSLIDGVSAVVFGKVFNF